MKLAQALNSYEKELIKIEKEIFNIDSQLINLMDRLKELFEKKVRAKEMIWLIKEELAGERFS